MYTCEGVDCPSPVVNVYDADVSDCLSRLNKSDIECEGRSERWIDDRNTIYLRLLFCNGGSCVYGDRYSRSPASLHERACLGLSGSQSDRLFEAFVNVHTRGAERERETGRGSIPGVGGRRSALANLSTNISTYQQVHSSVIQPAADFRLARAARGIHRSSHHRIIASSHHRSPPATSNHRIIASKHPTSVYIQVDTYI
jgi:hypothetical protein